ncbi:helix-turn-helix domain-containing protein [Bacillus sp. FJAT-28004]|uniref:helix-turn-helix domain-containing protein n=1 Tax=Bacillus sp. FJAT-28004 TaxID=1679165 RepID=UPI0006B69DC5|nr:AraC family transcriptional regulator [Bacillus sp. FJAT-28004]
MEQLFSIQKLYTSILMEWMHYAKVPKGWSFPNHKHSLFEFIYCASGRMEQWVNGQSFILQEGDSLIIKYGHVHHTAELTEDTEFFVFHFDMDMKEVQTIFQVVPNPHIPSGQEDNGICSVSRRVRDFLDEFKELLIHHNDLAEYVDNRMEQSVKLLRMQMRVIDLICLIAEHFTRESSVYLNSSMSPAQINLAHEVAFQLESHSGERLQINELAEKTGFHRSYVSSCFKEVYGISPRKYLTKIKVRTAKQLLQNTELTVTEIAEKLEFSSPAHFSKFFLNNVGLPPLKYRNQLYQYSNHPIKSNDDITEKELL